MQCVKQEQNGDHKMTDWNDEPYESDSPARETLSGIYQGYAYTYKSLIDFANEHQLWWKRPGLVPSMIVGSSFIYFENNYSECVFAFIMIEDNDVQDAQMWKCVYSKDVSRETLSSESVQDTNTHANRSKGGCTHHDL